MVENYSAADQERFLTEERRSGVRRTEFARDRARVLHSSALRRLGAKTQVLSPSSGDFARTRLTHSLEVAQIGREMAVDLGLSADVVDLACLAHDLGHPPFGHNGERALNDWAWDIGGFEGNAQTLRLLTRIEPKVFRADGTSVGLNLTRAALDATCKYPWGLDTSVFEAGSGGNTKFGYYPDDKEVFDWLRIGAPERRKCIEAQVMDFADDVAYSVHDLEDAIVAGFVAFDELNDEERSHELLKKISDWNGGQISWVELDSALTRIRENVYWPTRFDGEMSQLGTLKNLTSALIGSFVSRTTQASFESSPAVSLVRFQGSLVIPDDVLAEISVLKGLVSAFLMSHESRRNFYEWQRAILTELADALLSANGMHLDSYASDAWQSAKRLNDEAALKRVIVDQVACLTDQSAIRMHHDLVTKGS